jgi:cobalamin biosynthesis protein CbiG
VTVAVGVGASRGCPADELEDLVAAALEAAALTHADVALLATADVKAGEPALVALARAHRWPLRFYTAARLARVPVPTPSAVVAAHVGTPSVAEAAALLAAGRGAELVVDKRRSAHATCAIARS